MCYGYAIWVRQWQSDLQRILRLGLNRHRSNPEFRKDALCASSSRKLGKAARNLLSCASPGPCAEHAIYRRARDLLAREGYRWHRILSGVRERQRQASQVGGATRGGCYGTATNLRGSSRRDGISPRECGSGSGNVKRGASRASIWLPRASRSALALGRSIRGPKAGSRWSVLSPDEWAIPETFCDYDRSYWLPSLSAKQTRSDPNAVSPGTLSVNAPIRGIHTALSATNGCGTPSRLSEQLEAVGALLKAHPT